MTSPFGCLKRCCFVWTVEKPFKGRSRKSPDFTYKGNKFHLELYMYGSDNAYGLRMASEDADALPTHVVVHLENNKLYSETLSDRNWYTFSDGKQIIWCHNESAILRQYPALNTEGILKFLVSFIDDQVELAKHDPSAGFQKDKSVQVDISVQEDKSVQIDISVQEDKSVQTSDYMNTLSCLENLSEDLCKLLDRGTEPDVLLICGDLKVKIHRNILSTRSEVFAAMLNSDMAEGRTGSVEISDMDQALFDLFVRYLYSGKLPDLTVDIAKGFYEAADKYAMKCLMRRCSSFLKDNLDLENVYEMLVLADAHSDADFKQRVMEYILQQEIHRKQGDRWLAFCKSQAILAIEVLNLSYKQPEELKSA